MSDLIRVVDQEIWTRIGVTDEERAQPQRLLVTLSIFVENVPQAAATDEISQALNYFEVVLFLLKFAEENRRKLIETFAEHLAQELLASFPIDKIQIELKKFILPKAAFVSIQIERDSPKRL